MMGAAPDIWLVYTVMWPSLDISIAQRGEGNRCDPCHGPWSIEEGETEEDEVGLILQLTICNTQGA